jgi:hypothetical protein
VPKLQDHPEREIHSQRQAQPKQQEQPEQQFHPQRQAQPKQQKQQPPQRWQHLGRRSQPAKGRLQRPWNVPKRQL